MFHRNILLGLFRSIDNSTYLQLSCIFHAITNLVIFSIHLSMKLINPSKLHSSPFFIMKVNIILICIFRVDFLENAISFTVKNEGLPYTYISVSIRKPCFHTLHLQTAILNHIYKKRAIAKATALWLPLLDSNQRPFG